MKELIKRIRIPNEDIRIFYHELLVINTFSFQRLYGMKQLGLAYMVFPFATHTRAAHSLDTLNKAQEIINCIKENIETSLQSGIISEERKKFLTKFKPQLEADVYLIRLAALLHDIAHVPFSHSLEDENKILEKHDKSKRIDQIISFLKKEIPLPEDLESLNSTHLLLGFESSTDYEKAYNDIMQLLEDVKKVLWTIANDDKNDTATIQDKILPPHQHYIADLVGNTICADLLSYIRRDVDFTGIETRAGGAYRLMDYFDIDTVNGKTRLVIKLTKKGELRTDVITAIVGILNARFSIAEQVIFHHAKCAASAMLGKICRLCNLGATINEDIQVEKSKPQIYDIGDEGMIELIRKLIEKSPQKEVAGNLLGNLLSRRFYKRIGILSYGLADKNCADQIEEVYKNPQRIEEAENLIENFFHLPPGSIIIFCPQIKFKEAKTLVKYEKYSLEKQRMEMKITELNGTDFQNDWPEFYRLRIKPVEDQYNALKKMYVFLNPMLFKLYAASINAMLEKFLRTDILGLKWDIGLKKYLERKKDYKISQDIFEQIDNIIPKEDLSRFYEVFPKYVESNAELRKSYKWKKKDIEKLIRNCYDQIITSKKQLKLEINE